MPFFIYEELHEAMMESMTTNPPKTVRISPQTGTAFHLLKGESLTVIDPAGQQVADLFCADKNDLTDVLSSGRSIDYNDTLFFTVGHLLYAHSGNVLLEITEDSCGRHDFLVTPCSLQMFQMLAGRPIQHPSCEHNLATHLGAQGFDSSRITTTFNIFMNVEVTEKGRVKVGVPKSRAGDSITLKAHRDLLVGLTACSDEGTNNGVCKPIEYFITPAVR